MGIGFALASGLVGGFTRNIQGEMERRAAEEEKLDTYRALLMKAGLEGNASQKNIDLIGGFIQNAQQKLDDREKIGLFGKRTEAANIDNDFTGILSTLESTSNYKTKIGSFEFQNDLNKFGKDDSYSALNEMATVFGTQQGQQMLRSATDDELKKLHGLYATHLLFLDNEYQIAKQNDVAYDIDVPTQFGRFEPFLNITSERIGKGPYDGTDPADVASGGEISVSNPESRLLVDFNDQTYGEQYRTVSSAFGFKPDQGEQFAKFWTEYTSISGFELEDKQQVLDTTAQIIKVFQDEGLDLNLNSQSTAFQMQGEDIAKKIIRIVSEGTGGDTVKMALVLGTFAPIDDFMTRTKGIRYLDPKSSGRKVAAQLVFGPQATEDQFNEILKIDQELDTVLGSAPDGSVPGTGLRGFLAEVKQLEGPLAVDKLYSVIATGKSVLNDFFGRDDANMWQQGANAGTVISGQYIQAEQTVVSDDLAKSRANKINQETGKLYRDEDLTSGYLLNLDNKVYQAYQRGLQEASRAGIRGEKATERAIRFAKIEASRISLAFQMARAADPSGRLSNQDIEAQLIRLGTNWDAPEVLEQRVMKTIQEFETIQNRYKTMVKFGRSTGPVRLWEKKQLKGAHTLMELSRLAGFQTPEQAITDTGGGVTPMIPFDPETMYLYNGVPHSNTTLEPVGNIDPSTIPTGDST